MKIAPSILSSDYVNMERDIHVVEEAGADVIHVDIMDGHFVPNLSFGPGIVSALRPITNLPLDVHLMVTDPDMWIEPFAKAGADTIMAHVEATPHIHRTLQLMKASGVKAGIVVNPGTSLSTIDELLPNVDQVLVMTVNPGFGGQKFLPEMADKVRRLSDMRKARGLQFDIEVDGGISDQTIESCLTAGADIFVAGSYVFSKGEPAAQIAKLRAFEH
ncbi:ribulose-phosphate 3-epimerase [Lacticaseibacillus nasuensis]|uniref:Ribulose-phosphate 3-epimerase n=1 Tax=Lacticaseibacillus nasuensis JCM 17158 TaxID=1291734 RepID=A0A0R1JSH5_9LACO|nr:ribulose-phosphate 3-epimerase [Lacticaseibacillus nasuensis]KRK74310.1 ribulose-phosphate 3-epimerase [Lacticaseibacillus nasuensis JCM 17158]